MALELLRRGQTAKIVARGQSMWPFLLDGDALMLESLRGRAPGLGDIVLVAAGEFGFIHRVVAKRRGGRCLIKGDALPRADGWYAPASLLARVAEARRGGRAFVPARCLPIPISFAIGMLRALMR